MTLDAETLERILLDHSVGETTPDTEVLLLAYLAENPQAAQMARHVEQTVDTARRTLRLDDAAEVADLPPPAFLHQRPAQMQPGRRGWPGLKTLAVAAMIVMAFWLGRQAPQQQPFHQRALVQNQVGSQRQTPSESKGGFWSVARLQRAFSTRSAPNHRMIQWPSPLRRPRFGGQS